MSESSEITEEIITQDIQEQSTVEEPMVEVSNPITEELVSSEEIALMEEQVIEQVEEKWKNK